MYQNKNLRPISIGVVEKQGWVGAQGASPMNPEKNSYKAETDTGKDTF